MADTLLPDVSEFQAGASAPDWAGIKRQNGGAAIIRVGYGTSHLDHMFTANYTAVKKNGFAFTGLYQYIVAGQDITAQARAFCNWIGPASAVAPGTVFIADLEEGGGDQSGRANTWLGIVDKFYRLDARPLPARSWLYAGAAFAADHGLAPIFSSPRRTWIAAYSAAEPRLGHTLWQSTDGAVGSHITAWAGCGKVDTSVYHGPLAGLAAMGWGATVTRPPAQPPASGADERYHGEYECGGMFHLAALADKLGWPTNTLLRMTAVHYGTYGDDLGRWINDVMTGAKPWTTPVPKGVRLWCD